MINQNAIIEWRKNAPWTEQRFVEQDLVISRALVEIFSDDMLASKLAFRGGTAIGKLYLSPPARYSEDIDLVQVKAEPIGEVLDRIKAAMSFLGSPKTKRKLSNNVLLYQFEAENSGGLRLRLKIEINCKEHFFVFHPVKAPFKVENQWFSGECEVSTYCFDELIGTKLRALYQRRKGRDLFDVYKAIESGMLDSPRSIECYRKYMAFSNGYVPSAKEYANNLSAKLLDPGFTSDITPILAADQVYDICKAYDVVCEKILSAM